MATKYQDFKLNPATGDLDLSGNTLNIIDSNILSLQQRLIMRLSVWQGNWEYDLALGFPYRDYIGNKVVKAVLDAKIQQTIRLEDDVLAIENFKSTLKNASRSYSAYMEVITQEDETVPIAFVAADDYFYPEGTGLPTSICDENGQVEYGGKLYYLINYQMPKGQVSTWDNGWK